MNEMIAKGFYDSIVEGNLQIYKRKIINSEYETRVTDYDKMLAGIYASLSSDERLFMVI